MKSVRPLSIELTPSRWRFFFWPWFGALVALWITPVFWPVRLLGTVFIVFSVWRSAAARRAVDRIEYDTAGAWCLGLRCGDVLPGRLTDRLFGPAGWLCLSFVTPSGARAVLIGPHNADPQVLRRLRIALKLGQVRPRC